MADRACDICRQVVDDEVNGIIDDTGQFVCMDCQEDEGFDLGDE